MKVVKKKLVVNFVAGLLVFISIPATIAIAQEAPAQEPLEMTTTSIEDESGEAPAEERATRIEKYKQRAAERLSNSQQTRITGRCKNAQNVIERLSANAQTVVNNRQSVYSGVVDRLNNLSLKVTAAGIDTTELTAAIVELETKKEAFGLTADSYLVTLNDLAVMDCESDPEGFKSALKIAREDRVDLFKLSQEMRSYINDTIKPILQGIRTALSDSAAE